MKDCSTEHTMKLGSLIDILFIVPIFVFENLIGYIFQRVS